MCSIFFTFNNKSNITMLIEALNKIKNRGPESTNYKLIDNLFFGFNRLAINGLDTVSNQPLISNDYTLICNGEIYNHKELINQYNLKTKTKSDCEVISCLYDKLGINKTINLLDGVFSFILYDNKKKLLYVARDTFGVRPLFYGFNYKNNSIAFSSELKSLSYLNYDRVEQYEPNYLTTFSINCDSIKLVSKILISQYPSINNHLHNIKDVYKLVSHSFVSAVKKRVDNTDRDICCLLSGGLDSSLVTAIVCKFIDPSKLHTFSIGFKNSPDIDKAKIVANHLGTIHHEIIMTEKDFIDAIPQVIYNIESYDTTTVRASVGNYLICKYISDNFKNLKVVFNGDGSDELTGGYLYFNFCPDSLDFDKECKRLLNDIHFFDVLRSDRSISSNGLEARTPFLDKNFVNTYLSIPTFIRDHNNNNNIEKYLLRKSMAYWNDVIQSFDNKLLPDSILFRTKEAFSDGVSSSSNSWHNIIKNHCNNMFLDNYSIDTFNYPDTNEKIFYRSIFDKYYKNYCNVIPYFWMPRFVLSRDASARDLTSLDNSNKLKNSNKNNSNEFNKNNFDFNKNMNKLPSCNSLNGLNYII